MKGMRKWAVANLAVVSSLLLLMTEPGVSQVRAGVPLACPSGLEEGDLGISGLDCVGECTLTIKDEGRERSWFFSTEPRILGVDRGGPADGILQVGDYLVAIDETPITSKEGGKRFASVQSGERVSLRYRRDGQVREARIRVESRCREMPEVAVAVSRVPLPPLEPDAPRVAVGVAVAPRVRVAPTRRVTAVDVGVEAVPSISRRATRGILARMSPTGHLGIGFSCTVCGTQTDEETGEDVWFFSGSLEVTAVNVGGPADEAGIQRGDLIKAIDGHAIDTDEGGVAFTRLTPGKRVRLTVVKRNGAEVEVSLVPEEVVRAGVARGRSGRADVAPPRAVGVTARAVEPTRRAGEAPPVPPTAPERVDVPAPTAMVTAPEGMPLRYSGTVSGVEVEVRGNPVMVSEMEGTRTLYINADGLWIRITVLRERE